MSEYRAWTVETTLAELIDAQMGAGSALAPTTRRNYARAADRLKIVFGALRPSQLQAAWVQHYLAERSATPQAANYDRAFLSTVMAAAVRAGLVASNPVRDVRRHPAPPRDRYVSDAELDDFRRHCSDRLNAYLDLKMATGARQAQLVGLCRHHYSSSSGLFVAGVKGGRDVSYHGPGVDEAVRRCARAFHRQPVDEVPPSAPLICRLRGGGPYRSAKSWMRTWQRVMSEYVATGGERFTEHDLRAKVASDSPDVATAQARLGHKSSNMTVRVYIRAPLRVASASIQRAERQPDLFDETTGGVAPSSDTSSAKSPARSAAVAARRATPPASVGGPAVSVPQVAARGPRGLKRQGDESQDDSQAASAARSPLRREPAAGTSAGSPATSDAAASQPFPAASKPPARAGKRTPAAGTRRGGQAR